MEISNKPAIYKISPPHPGGSLSVDTEIVNDFPWSLEFASTEINAANAINWLFQKEARQTEPKVVKSTLHKINTVCETVISENPRKIREFRKRALVLSSTSFLAFTSG